VESKNIVVIIGYAGFMIGYFMLLTVVLPSTMMLEPDWLEVGSFAEYLVEDIGGDEVVMNGTYTWKVIAIRNLNGGNTVTVNETFQGTTHWDHVDAIPPSGRIVNVSATEGVVEGLVLWLKRYYNYFLLDRSYFLGQGYTYLGVREGNALFQGEVRSFVEVYPKINSIRLSRFDKATGLFSYHSWTWPRLGTVFVSLKSTNVFESANVTEEIDGLKVILDALLVSPLIALPLTGAVFGLFLIRKRNIRFSKSFWFAFILLNGAISALLANWPFKIPKQPHYLAGYFPHVLTCLIDIFLWIGILGVAVFAINRFVFPIIEPSD